MPVSAQAATWVHRLPASACFSCLAYGDDTLPSAIPGAGLEVEAPIGLRARRRRPRRGGQVQLRGDGAPHAALRLLADRPGASGWWALAKVRAGGDGRWLGKAGFPAVSGGNRLRARVAASPRRGHLAAASAPVSLEVR